MNGLLDELLYYYYVHDKFQVNYLDEEEAKKYHQTLIEKNRILTVFGEERLLGYAEFWNINFEQLGRIICHEPFFIQKEDIESGNIAYLSNTTIHPDHRRTEVYRELRTQFMNRNSHCDYFIGQALRKKHQPIKVFKNKLKDKR